MRMDEPVPTQSLVKLLLIADGKLGKTHYAAMAAKAGFNILYLDGDVASATIRSMGTPVNNVVALTKKDLSRIHLLDVRDTILGGQRDTKMIATINEFISSVTFKWNDSEHRMLTRKDQNCDVVEIKPALMGPNDLLVIDSWTSLAQSIMTWCGVANGVNIADATTSEMRPVYQGGALKTSEILQVIRSLRCHVIVIAHPDEYSHMTKPEGRKAGEIKEVDMIVDWTKMIPKTTSKPQGLTMGPYFTDIAWMELSPAGTERRLNFKPKNDRVSGGHFSESKSVDEYSFVNLVKQIGGFMPTGEGPESWLTMRRIDEISAEAEAKAESKVLDGTKGTAAKTPGLADLLKKPAVAQG